MRRKKFFIVTVNTIILFFFLIGCNIFETRTPEEPISEVSWNFFPITANQTFDNLLYSFDFAENIERYSSILSGDFSFYFDSQDISDFNLPTFWGKEEEVKMREMLNVSVRVSISPIEDKDDIIYANETIYHRNYNVHTPGQVFTGSMAVFLRRENDGFWRIYRWEDYRISNEVTWGRFKYETAPQLFIK